MSENTNSFGWRLKNAWFYIFSFVPFLQWIPFFISNGKIPKKRWVILGFANIAVVVVAFSMSMMSAAYRENRMPDQPEGRPEQPEDTRPQINDYMGKNYWEDDNYMDSPEYKKYEDALDEWFESPEYKAYEDELKDWYNTPEYKEYEKKSDAVYRTSMGFVSAGGVTLVLSWLVFMILGFFVEKYKFLRELSNKTNRSNVYRQIDMAPSGIAAGSAPVPRHLQGPQGMNSQRPMPMAGSPVPPPPMNQQFNIPTVNSSMQPGNIPPQGPVGNIPPQGPVGNPNTGVLLDINRATENELVNLPGINTIDVKKILEYRGKQGGFRTLDEFFDSFSAKPHVLVRVQKLITINPMQLGPGYAAPVNSMPMNQPSMNPMPMDPDMVATVDESENAPKPGGPVVNRRFDL